MADIVTMLWIPVVLLAIGAIIWAVRYETRKQARQMNAKAAELGLAHGKPPMAFVKSQAKTTFLFSRGGNKKISLWLEGTYAGRPTRFFEYQYRFGVPFIANVTYYQSVAAFAIAAGRLPVFQLRPASSVEKLATQLGYSSVRFDSHPKFSSAYLLQGPEESRIRQLFLPPVLEFFERLPQANTHVDSSGDWLFIYEHASRIRASLLVEFLNGSCEVVDALLR